MEILKHEILLDEILLDDYYNFNSIIGFTIFDEWLVEEGKLGDWARRQFENEKWKKTEIKSSKKHFVYLSK